MLSESYFRAEGVEGAGLTAHLILKIIKEGFEPLTPL